MLADGEFIGEDGGTCSDALGNRRLKADTPQSECAPAETGAPMVPGYCRACKGGSREGPMGELRPSKLAVVNPGVT